MRVSAPVLDLAGVDLPGIFEFALRENADLALARLSARDGVLLVEHELPLRGSGIPAFAASVSARRRRGAQAGRPNSRPPSRTERSLLWRAGRVFSSQCDPAVLLARNETWRLASRSRGQASAGRVPRTGRRHRRGAPGLRHACARLAAPRLAHHCISRRGGHTLRPRRRRKAEIEGRLVRTRAHPREIVSVGVSERQPATHGPSRRGVPVSARACRWSARHTAAASSQPSVAAHTALDDAGRAA